MGGQRRAVIGYRLYLFDGDRGRGERMTRSLTLDVDTEAEAVAEAEQRRMGRYAELWRFEHVVKVFDPEG